VVGPVIPGVNRI